MTRPGSPALPAFAELRADASWQAVDFISDLHLAENTPRTFEAFARHLRHTPADAVFILGDLFEVWIGDDSRHEGFEARCWDVLADAASHRLVAFMAGNRDFLVGADMLGSCGVMGLADPTVLIAFDERVLLSHGDSLCLADLAYQQFRKQVRSSQWQEDFLAQPLAARRATVREIRDESQRRKAHQEPGEWADVDKTAAVDWMLSASTPTLIHGHTHAPGSESMTAGFVRHVLSDWDLDHPGAAPRAEVLRWRRGGMERVRPAGAPGTAP